GLRGEEIPEYARMVAVADAFDAMTSTRCYSRARPVPAAVAELERCAGTHFDPRMVDALVRALDRHGWRPAVTADETAPPAARPPGAAPAAQVPVARATGSQDPERPARPESPPDPGAPVGPPHPVDPARHRERA
ncbi:HD domain-containing phosphohydrolase, partial [Streptomyces sp.]|uniref:HD-GYP domain-containing protein n=1 Tax=Streptomyces sp. TaxID=1931 RepID=UPI0035C6871A